jgi:murein DD-endopeptidase MepM/ murein hydrolase activator NlpD
LCVPTASGAGEVEGAVAETNAHVDRLGRRVVYEHLPRRPELPEDYDRSVYPTGPGLSGGHYVSSGYDLDRPDALQRRGEALSAVGHGGLDLPEARGAPVRVVALRGEVGDPLVVYVGVLFGTTVVLRHTVREHGRLRVYLSLHGHLDRPAPGLVPGHGLEPGAVLGFVGDSGALGVVHLHYEVRLLRPGVDPARVEPGRLTDQTVSIPCDPRNVLPLR